MDRRQVFQPLKAKKDPYRRCVHRYLMRRYNKKDDESLGFETTFNKCSDEKIASGETYEECLWTELGEAERTVNVVEEVEIFEEPEPDEPPPPPASIKRPIIKAASGDTRAVISLVVIFISMLI